jgi:hypothetical protein
MIPASFSDILLRKQKWENWKTGTDVLIIILLSQEVKYKNNEAGLLWLHIPTYFILKKSKAKLWEYNCGTASMANNDDFIIVIKTTGTINFSTSSIWKTTA